MSQLGRVNILPLLQKADGAYVDAAEFGLVPLSTSKAFFDPLPKTVKAFLYRDNNGVVLATMQWPKVQAGECAFLEVSSVTPIGVFMNWGLEKELFVPFSEQQQDMQVGKRYVVHVSLDKQERMVASAKLDRILDKTPHSYKVGDLVDVLIAGRTEMGFKAVVGHSHWGLLYHDQIFQRVRIGDRIQASIAKVRDDGKIDLSMGASGKQSVDELGTRILSKLREQDGYLALTDKSSPQVISAIFGVSKGAFKKAIGSLYKQGLITISKTGLVLNNDK